MALHQAANAVHAAGGEASVMYIKHQSRQNAWSIKRDSDSIVSTLGFIRRNRVDKRLVDLKSPTTLEVSVNDHFVVPESMPTLAYALIEMGCPNVYFWWLSVDNFPLSDAKLLSTQTIMRTCVHLCQSHYASDYVMKNGGSQTLMLSDVTEIEEQGLEDNPNERRYDFAYLPNKAQGAEGLIRSLDAKYLGIPLQKMSRAEMAATLRNTKIFVDFGHHPGKDRVPREAVICGALPIIRREGAAGFFEDVPVPDALLVDTEAFFNFDTFEKRFSQVHSELTVWRGKLAGYRAWISQEDQRFEDEIKDMIAFARKRDAP